MLKDKKILLIYTGGTIGMMQRKDDNILVPFDFSHIESKLPELQMLGSQIDVESYDPPLDSSNIGPPVWVQIARTIEEKYDNYDGFVILHGSDTMAYTGSALSFMIEGLDKPVILTGAQLPFNEIRTDARENLVAAIEIAAHPDQPIREVAIYFEYKLFRANRTKKVHADVFHAFNSPNFPLLAQAGVHLKFYRPTPSDAWEGIPFRIQTNLETNIGHKKFFPGITDHVMDRMLLDPEVNGIIIESYGSGNLPTDSHLIDTIRKSIDMGKIILNITQCTAGAVEMGRYETSKLLQQVGVIGGRDLTFEAALTKMMYVLGKYKDPDKRKYYLQHNIRGEMTADRGYTR